MILRARRGPVEPVDVQEGSQEPGTLRDEPVIVDRSEELAEVERLGLLRSPQPGRREARLRDDDVSLPTPLGPAKVVTVH